MLLSAAMLVVPLLSGPAAAEQKVITGTVSYRARTTLPSDAALTVELDDVTVATSPVAIAEARVAPAGNSPIAFSLPFEAGRILGGHRYGLRAVIAQGQTQLFATDDKRIVDPLSTRYAVDLDLVAAGGSGSDSGDGDSGD